MALALAAMAIACAGPHPSSRTANGWALIRPPEVADPQAPRGYRLIPGAPQSEWLRQATFDSEAQCDDARQNDAQTAISRARATAGDDAKFDLDVRRAVNARCVRLER